MVVRDVFDGHFEEFEAVEGVEWSLLRDLFEGSEYPAVGLFPVFPVKVPFLQFEQDASYLFRLELYQLRKQQLRRPLQVLHQLS
jgi:hypothetical protein